MRTKLLLILATTGLLLSRCSKDAGSSGGMKLWQVYAEGQLQVEHSYNSQGLLDHQVVYGLPGRKSYEATCYYDAEKRLIKKETAVDFSSGPNPVWSYSYTEYRYAADSRLSEELNYIKQNNVDVLTSKIKPGYDSQGRLVSRSLYNPNDVLGLLTTYQYNAAGNIVLQEQFRYNGAVPSIEYRYRYDNYDNQRNPYVGLPSATPPFSVNVNNILQTTVTNYVTTPGSPVTSTNNAVYNSYNSRGLPLKLFENGFNYSFEYR